MRIGELLVGKYRVERLLGEGGMGMVVAATHVELDQLVAIKCLLREVSKNKSAVDRFAREARACAKLRGENVVHVTDVGVLESGAPFMVMEYLEGEDLGQHLQARGPLSVDDAIDYVLQACAGLAEAHAAGIVHRDLKPANLFLATRADSGCVLKVVDFGISKLMGGATTDDLTLTQDLMGSPLYMSPEQLRSLRDVDARTDIWALGIILYELLAGAPPFQGDTLPQVCSAVLVNELPPLHERRAELPEGLAELVAKCLEKEPDSRFANVAELAEALAPYAPARSAATLARIARQTSTSVTEPSADARSEPMPAPTAATAPGGRSRFPALWIVIGALVVAVVVLLVMRREPPVSPTSSPAAPLASAPPTAFGSTLGPAASASSSVAAATPPSATARPASSVAKTAPTPGPHASASAPPSKESVPSASASASAGAAASVSAKEEANPYDEPPVVPTSKGEAGL